MDDDKIQEKERANQNNAQNVKNAADVAVASGNPYAMAAGAGLKAVDKVTGGKGSEIVGKALTAANQVLPAGRHAQEGLNKLNESGAGDKIGKAASVKSQMGGNPSDTPNQVKNPKTEGGEQGSSLPSSSDNKNKNQTPGLGGSSSDSSRGRRRGKGKDESSGSTSESSETDSIFGGKSSVAIKMATKIALSIMVPIIVILIPIIVIVVGVVGEYFDFDDAVGMSYVAGMDTGTLDFQAESKAQTDFYNRVLEVKNSNAASGRDVDVLKVVAVYHVLKENNASVSYENMTKEKIQEIVDCMYSGSSTSDEIFKTNLIRYLIPKYLPNSQDSKRVSIADQVFQYIDDYYSLIGKKQTTCANGGTCSYDIKGFYIHGSGEIKKEMKVSDLYVRLMQCGGRYGGTNGLPLEGEDLVPFEKYVLGVAYLEIGPSAPAEAIKAQMVAARSYILARPTDMKGWRTLKQENGKWVLQAAACTMDQVYCDPDQGCSWDNAQWGQVRSGTNKGKHHNDPLPQDSPMRTYASQTQGQVLVNANGYIIETYYKNADQENWKTLARSGLNYTQILMQYYNQGSHNYGARSVVNSSCSSGGSNCAKTGPYAGWKQYEGPWVNVTLGNSGKTIKQIGCLATSLAIQIAKSGVKTNISGEFNPGSFVQYLSNHGGFDNGGSIATWTGITAAAPGFVYQNEEYFNGMSREQKLNRIKEIVNTPGVYAVCEVKGNTGQHWVAIDSVNGDTINMMDPGSSSTNMWAQYNWANTSKIVYYKVG